VGRALEEREYAGRVVDNGLASREQPRKSDATRDKYIMATRVMIKEWLRKDSNMLFILENARHQECNQLSLESPLGLTL
jgi:hypothetical protein